MNSQSGTKSSIYEDFWNKKISDKFLFEQLSRQKELEKVSELEDEGKSLHPI
ncbi:hypothetical protein FS842_005587 [Serendipita sp. 407]|nr:hypothetical protein FRC20_007846 [Serendipita sp. 405]KAG9023997.1 hypothetical protein FS842_005587 [Serendipita sp. 407]